MAGYAPALSATKHLANAQVMQAQTNWDVLCHKSSFPCSHQQSPVNVGIPLVKHEPAMLSVDSDSLQHLSSAKALGMPLSTGSILKR